MRLTIVIPTVNRAYCLRRAVESALAQDEREIEVLVSNNASADGTRALLTDIVNERKDPRLRVVHHADRLSVTDHGNYLLAEARGKLFLGLSDDDWIEPGLAGRVLSLFRAHPEISFVYTGCRMHFGEFELLSPTGPEMEGTIDFLEAYLAGKRQVYWCGCVSRTADLRRIGPIPSDRLIGDMFYWTKLAFQGPVGCVPEPLTHYTYMADNLSIGIPASRWANETALLVTEITGGLRGLDMNAGRYQRIAREGRRYLARSTANQLVLNAQRGMRKAQVARELSACARHLTGDLTGLPRILAALTLPPSTLRHLTRRFVRRLSRRLIAGPGGRVRAWHEASSPLSRWRSRVTD